MAEQTNISWCDSTFSPWEGCTKVSPGCAHCYAGTRNKRWNKTAINWGPGAPRQRRSEHYWKQPLKWNKQAGLTESRPRVFCGSLCDWLDDEVPIEWLADLLDLIRATPHLDWLLLTKRPHAFDVRMENALVHTGMDTRYWLQDWSRDAPPHNVWIGTTTEDQHRADLRIPALLDIPARIRFLSCEPLLEALDLSGYFGGPHVGLPGDVILPNYNFGIDWLICGEETGPHARVMKPVWACSLRDQCAAASIPFFFKQEGNRRTLDGQTHHNFPS